jgi:pimeloyl-ACP methyl ester carboxylesterase
MNATTTPTLFIETENHRFAYRRFGNGSPLLLFNRFRGTLDDWDPAFLDKLARQREVIYFDNVGVGGTKGSCPDTIKEMAIDALEFADALQLEQFNLLGWSMGGLLAQAFTLRYPQRVNKLILIGTGPAASPTTEYPGEAFLDIATKVFHMEPEHHQTVFFTPTSSGQEYTNQSLLRMAQRTNDRVPLTQPPTWQAQGLATRDFFNHPTNYFERIKSITQPTLILGAKEDIAFSAHDSTLLYQQIPNSSLFLYSNAGHAFHHQYPEHATQLINTFLNSAVL